MSDLIAAVVTPDTSGSPAESHPVVPTVCQKRADGLHPRVRIVIGTAVKGRRQWTGVWDNAVALRRSGERPLPGVDGTHRRSSRGCAQGCCQLLSTPHKTKRFSAAGASTPSRKQNRRIWTVEPSPVAPGRPLTLDLLKELPRSVDQNCADVAVTLDHGRHEPFCLLKREMGREGSNRRVGPDLDEGRAVSN